MTVPDLMGALAPAGKASRLRPHAGNTKGRKWPPDPPTVEDIVRALNVCTPQTPGRAGELSALRLRALIVLLWRTGLRISEALALEERDLMPQDMALVVRCGKGGKRRIAALDEWGWNEVRVWLGARQVLPPGPIFCVVRGHAAGRDALADCDVRRQFRQLADRAGLRCRFHPHGLRHACAVELWREGVDVFRIGQQFGHARPDITLLYLRSLTAVELLEPIGRRRPPMMLIPGRTSGG